jgi:hypothetical protein
MPSAAPTRVIPPDETTQLSMAFVGQLCQHGDITVGAFGRDLLADG